MQEELMNPLTAQTFNKDNSPVCRRSHHKIMQEKGSLFPSLLFPSPSIHSTCGTAFVTGFGGPTAIYLFTTSSRNVLGLYFYTLYMGHHWQREMPISPSQVSLFLLKGGTRGGLCSSLCPGTIMWAWQTLSLIGGLGSPPPCVRISKPQAEEISLHFSFLSTLLRAKKNKTEKLAHWCQKSLLHLQTLVKTDTKRDFLI